MERPAVQKGLDVPERNWIKEALADPEKVRRGIVDFVVPDMTGRHEEGGLRGRLFHCLLECTNRPM